MTAPMTKDQIRAAIDSAVLALILCVLAIVVAFSPSVRQEWASLSEDHGE